MIATSLYPHLWQGNYEVIPGVDPFSPEGVLQARTGVCSAYSRLYKGLTDVVIFSILPRATRILLACTRLDLLNLLKHPADSPRSPSSRRLVLRRCAVLGTLTPVRSQERRRNQATNGTASKSTASGRPAIALGLRVPWVETFSSQSTTMTSGGWFCHINSSTRTCARIRRCDCAIVGAVCCAFNSPDVLSQWLTL